MNEQSLGKQFNLQKELREYCESDVNILDRGAFKLRNIFLSETGVDPLLTSLTIASAWNHVFRKHFLKKNTIGIVPQGGCNRKEKQSVTAIRWLAEKDDIYIRHKLNGREIKIGPFKADGLEEATKTVFEYHGCYWHGCLDCFPNRQQLVANNSKTAEEAFQDTVEKRQFLEQQGYTVIEKWECSLTKELKVI